LRALRADVGGRLCFCCFPGFWRFSHSGCVRERAFLCCACSVFSFFSSRSAFLHFFALDAPSFLLLIQFLVALLTLFVSFVLRFLYCGFLSLVAFFLLLPAFRTVDLVYFFFVFLSCFLSRYCILFFLLNCFSYYLSYFCFCFTIFSSFSSLGSFILGSWFCVG
jgi:hypothetical protein